MKNKHIYWMVAGAVSLMLQSCAIPLISSKQADTTLPTQYQEAVAPAGNSAAVKWQDFFEDPHLVSLIDTAVNNIDN